MTPNLQCVELAIVGGGAAGLFAAAAAAERGIPTVLIERKARPGAKMLMTANGRCNFTKDISPEQFLADLGTTAHDRATASFVAGAVRACPPRKIIRAFQSLNVPLRRMPDARMFPADGKAATIVHVFGDLLREAEVPILTNCPVMGIEKVKGEGQGQGEVKGEGQGQRKVKGEGQGQEKVKGEGQGQERMFRVCTKNFDLLARNVLLATGGVSYPKTGSVGDGQNFARALGHTLVPYRPGLIGLETADRRVTALAGRRFEDGRAKVFDAGGRCLFEWRGEVDCERFGLSGAAVYNCQRFLEHAKPASWEIEVWFAHERLRFANLRPRPLKEAIVTLGGVSTDGIDPRTMQSKLVPGLFFAGEVLDIDGPTGGYNLTLAFATARAAVEAIGCRRGEAKIGSRGPRP